MPLAAILATIGPTIIRGVGSLFGGKAQDAANTVANVVEAVKGKPEDQQHQEISQALAKMTPDQVQAFEQVKAQIVQAHANVEQARIQAERDEQAAIQKTAQVEAQQSDIYTKRTRPGIARKSFYVGAGYVLIAAVVFPAVNAYAGTKLPGFEPSIFMALASPVLAYMGVRGLEKWKAGKA